MKFKTESQRDDDIQSLWELFGRISDLSLNTKILVTQFQTTFVRNIKLSVKTYP